MALSPHATWTRSMERGVVELRFHVAITVAAGKTYNFSDGNLTGATYAYTVSNVTPISRDIDPFKYIGGFSSGCSFTLALDWYTRQMITTYGVKGAYVDIDFGEVSVDVSNFEDYFTGIVDSITPKGNTHVVVKCKSIARKLLEATSYTGSLFAKHPLEILEVLLTTVSGSAWIDSTSLDPATHAASISHWVLSQSGTLDYEGDFTYTRNPEKVEQMFTNILRCLSGSMIAQEDGKVYFNRFDTTASSVADWTEDDIDEFEILELYERLYNKVTIKTHPTFLVTDYLSWVTIEDETSSGTTFKIFDGAGSNDNVCELAYEIPQITGRAPLKAAMTAGSPGVGGTFVLGTDTASELGQIAGFCGTRWDSFPTGAADADAVISAARLLVVKIDREYIECDLMTIDTDYVERASYTDPDGIATDVIIDSYREVPMKVTLQVKSRAAYGSTATAHAAGTMVYDQTIALSLADTLVDRYSNGAPVVKCTTNLSQHFVQLGDFVTVTTDRYISKGKSSLDTNTKWEVIGKDVDPHGDPPRITWTLLYATETAPPATSKAYAYALVDPKSISTSTGLAIASDSVAQKTTSSGFTLSGTAGFTTTVDEGYATNGAVTAKSFEQEITVNASKDTYVGYDFATRSLITVQTALGAGTPDKPGSTMWLQKIVSDGAGITGSTDLRTTEAIPGTSLEVGTGPLTHLSTGGLLDNITSVTARSLDNITDGASYKRVANVSASNECTRTSVEDDAINYRKIYTQTTFNFAINTNADFNVWDDL